MLCRGVTVVFGRLGVGANLPLLSRLGRDERCCTVSAGCREVSEAAFLEQEEDELAVAIAAMEDSRRRESQGAGVDETDWGGRGGDVGSELPAPVFVHVKDAFVDPSLTQE